MFCLGAVPERVAPALRPARWRVTTQPQPARCAWVGPDPLYIDYHDVEWGVPVHDDRTLFEFLILEGAQAGLSWLTILRRREGYRRAFAGFDPAVVAAFGADEVERLLADVGIIRNRRKVEAAVTNARAFLAVQEEYGSFDAYIWRFTEGRPIQNAWRSVRRPGHHAGRREPEPRSQASGFAFVGPTICHAHMQATGMVNDHTTDCFRWTELGGGA